LPNIPWETVLVRCRQSQIHILPLFSTVSCIFEGTFLYNHLQQSPAGLPLWSKQEKIVNFLLAKVLACRHLLQIHTGVYIVKFCSVPCIVGLKPYPSTQLSLHTKVNKRVRRAHNWYLHNWNWHNWAWESES
jgi:hypothetical protein